MVWPILGVLSYYFCFINRVLQIHWHKMSQVQPSSHHWMMIWWEIHKNRITVAAGQGDSTFSCLFWVTQLALAMCGAFLTCVTAMGVVSFYFYINFFVFQTDIDNETDFWSLCRRIWWLLKAGWSKRKVWGCKWGGENKEVPEHVHCIRQPLMNTTLLVPATTLFILDSFAVQGWDGASYPGMLFKKKKRGRTKENAKKNSVELFI